MTTTNLCIVHEQTRRPLNLYTQTVRQSDRKLNRQTDNQTRIQAIRQTNKQTNKQTDKQTHRRAHTQTHGHKHIFSQYCLHFIIYSSYVYTDTYSQIESDPIVPTCCYSLLLVANILWLVDCQHTLGASPNSLLN